MRYDGLDRFVDGRIDDLINTIETSTYGTIESINEDSINVYLPSRDILLNDVPVFTLQGGGEYIQFPIKKNDKVLVVFTKDSALDFISGNEIDSSYTFDINSGFALVGLNTLSEPLALTQITKLTVSKIKVENDTAELIATISDIAGKLIDTISAIEALTVTTSGVPSTVPNNVATFTTLKSDLSTLKSDLDTFRE